MIVLKRANTTLIEKTIQPGSTEEFFVIDLERSEAFDWGLKTIMPSTGARGITKISSLYTGNNIESTTYARLGTRFNTNVDINMSASGDSCEFAITNNESSLIQCSVKLKIF